MAQAKAFPFRAQDRRWKTPLGRFVDFFGADELAARVEVHRSAVYHWLSGKADPRPAVAMRIVRVARSSDFAISFDDIYANFARPVSGVAERRKKWTPKL
jgi:DNA-binding XRE family transcriptional regulator